MDVYHIAADETVRRLSGPADVYTVADGEIVVSEPTSERDAAHWAAALGLAVMRDIPVGRRTRP